MLFEFSEHNQVVFVLNVWLLPEVSDTLGVYFHVVDPTLLCFQKFLLADHLQGRGQSNSYLAITLSTCLVPFLTSPLPAEMTPAKAPPILTPAHVSAPSQKVGNTTNIVPITILTIKSSEVFCKPYRLKCEAPFSL